MKKILLLIFHISVLATHVFSQTPLSGLKAPSSPAAQLLGMQPAASLHPKSYNELEISLYSNLYENENTSLIPSEFALEFTPYWITDHGLSLQDYLYPENTFSGQILRNSSISLASTPNYILNGGTKSKSIALGYRTTIHIPNTADKEALGGLNSVLEDKLDVLSSLKIFARAIVASDSSIDNSGFITRMKEEIYAEWEDARKSAELMKIVSSIVNSIPSTKEAEDYVKEFDTRLDAAVQIDTLVSVYQKHIQNRQGLFLNFAAGSMFNFPTNNLNFAYAPRYSLWFSPSYQFGPEFSFLRVSGALRYEWRNKDFVKTYFPDSAYYFNHAVDYSAALSMQFNRFTVQFELAGRSAGSNKSDVQYICSISYGITEELILSYNFGNRFKPEFDPDNTLISVLALNLGLGSPSSKDLSK